MSTGAVYVAFGDQYIKEAQEAAASFRFFNPKIPVCLISDADAQVDGFEIQIHTKRQSPVIRGKLEMFRSPFDRSLFLDTDTLVFSPLNEVFELLDTFDIVFRQDSSGYHYKLDGVPHAFPEPSTGVIGFRKSPKIERFAKSWAKYFDDYAADMGREWDQRSFRHAIYVSDLRHSVLPPEYNFMPYAPACASGDLRIIHGRPRELLQKTKRLMDRELGPRAYIPRIGCVRHYNQYSLGELVALSASALKVFAIEVAKRTAKRIGIYRSIQELFGRAPRVR